MQRLFTGAYDLNYVTHVIGADDVSAYMTSYT